MRRNSRYSPCFMLHLYSHNWLSRSGKCILHPQLFNPGNSCSRNDSKQLNLRKRHGFIYTQVLTMTIKTSVNGSINEALDHRVPVCNRALHRVLHDQRNRSLNAKSLTGALIERSEAALISLTLSLTEGLNRNAAISPLVSPVKVLLVGYRCSFWARTRLFI